MGPQYDSTLIPNICYQVKIFVIRIKELQFSGYNETVTIVLVCIVTIFIILLVTLLIRHIVRAIRAKQSVALSRLNRDIESDQRPNPQGGREAREEENPGAVDNREDTENNAEGIYDNMELYSL